jgi:hypothetical protein
MRSGFAQEEEVVGEQARIGQRRADAGHPHILSRPQMADVTAARKSVDVGELPGAEARTHF